MTIWDFASQHWFVSLIALIIVAHSLKWITVSFATIVVALLRRK